MLDKIAISSIKVTARHRRDMGDLRSLAQSIGDIGLLQPIGVTGDGTLVWGERRLRACRMLGWSEVPAIIDPSMADLQRAAKAEEQENTCRKPLTHSEAVAMAEAIKGYQREQAKKRQGRPGQERSGKFPERNKGDTRDKVAAVVGMSAPTLEKASRVVSSGEAKLVTMMDRGEVSVDAAARIATLPAEQQKQIIAAGPSRVAKAVKEVREKQKQESLKKRLREDPGEEIIDRWRKVMIDGLTPILSLRDLGIKDWARHFTKKQLRPMEQQLLLVIEGYQDLLKQVREVLLEEA